ncbi:MAG: hypothetical protein AAGC81_17110 [Pseudomonadota bacterium]
MSDQKTPEVLDENELDSAQGGVARGARRQLPIRSTIPLGVNGDDEEPKSFSSSASGSPNI